MKRLEKDSLGSIDVPKDALWGAQTQRSILNFAIGDEVIKINNLPPLIKGYLRVGGQVGDGAVIDSQFNTTDVCVIVKTESLPTRYRRHYQRSFSKSIQLQ